MLGVFYTCHLCRATEIKVEIPYRDPEVDVVVWMESVLMVALRKDHEKRSPGCFPEKLDQIKIPIKDAEWVGGPPKVLQ